MTLQSKHSLNAKRTLARLAESPSTSRICFTQQIVISNRRVIRKAMRMGHNLETLARELSVAKRTLQKYLAEEGLFFRKPRTNKGRAVKKNIAAILRAKRSALSNV